MTSRWSLRRVRLLLGGKLVLVLGLLLFVGLAWLVEKGAGINQPLHLHPLLALVMSGIPAALWLAVFYLQDRYEPEPKHFVIGVCVLGTVVASPVADFVLFQLSPPIALAQHGLSPFSMDRVVHAVLVVGLVQELSKYIVVRYTIYMSSEFDEPMDGVVYMMAVGTGFAVWVNYHRMSDLGHQVFLSTGAAQTVVTTLAHASFAGALGYVLGMIKFSSSGAPTRGAILLGGILLAAFLNGQFRIVEAWLTEEGLGHAPWKGIGYVALVALVVFGVLLLLANRLLAMSPHRRDRD